MIIRKRSYFILFIFLSFSYFSEIQGQVSLNSFGLDIGTIHNVDPNSEFISNDFLFFPEVFLSGVLIDSSFNWRINLGYWDDGRTEPKYSDRLNYSYSSIVTNIESIYLFPNSNPNHPAPLRFLLGLSHHYISAKNIEHYESNTTRKSDLTDNIFYLNTGLELHFFVKRYLSFFAKGMVFVELYNSDENDFKSPRLQLSLGVNYQFSK